MASYVETVIGNEESVEYQAKISLWSMSLLFIIGVLLLPFYGLGLIFFLYAYIRFKTTELAITNKKVIAKFGFIQRDTIELLLPKIESIQVNQSLFGRIFNFGSIVVSGAGNPQAPIPGISAPIQFRKTFMDVQEKTGG
jgi:uncharacterized membrane protein YdbT with pleckstrin-like domain